MPPEPAPTTAAGVVLARIHLVGVGGAGMSAIARILADRGLDVSGSDVKDSAVLAALSVRGVRTVVGHRPENLDLFGEQGPTAVVVSTAIRPDNPELVAARDRGIAVVRRADALAALMIGRRSICIAGTHGKTSTTSMLTVALQHAGVDPSFAIGGELNESGSGAHHGSGDLFIAEADESDSSFLAFAPQGAIITNLEPDHLDHHGSAEAYAAVFDAFVRRIVPGGFLIVCLDDAGVRALLDRLQRNPSGVPEGLRVIGYGTAADAPIRITAFGADGPFSRAELVLPDGTSAAIELAVPGEHMLRNATAAFTAGVLAGVSPATMVEGLASYTGVRRRFQFKGRAAGVTVYDDYAHHPTEVRAQLEAARTVVPVGGGRLVVVFQPHLYSRTATFAPEFAAALSLADVVVVLDVYGAREDPQPGVTGALIADAVSAPEVIFEPSLARAADVVAGLVRVDDVVVTMGAGDVTMLGPEILDRLDAGPDPDGALGHA
ncbi:UDP-N-acetylmuramate--L-alanine ligase [Nakamurella sp. A5-74]|uniref:UDP-N-acetylmuramate--L-alanine ligase n=1 Tax=Nakamurella sp. A5-74 TaxID=3158264 RepID=A0AAU8DW09_9ACTN